MGFDKNDAAGAFCSPDAVIDFWFGPLKDGFTVEPRHSLWFSGSETDEVIREKFAPCVESSLSGKLNNWNQTASGRLASIILLDQFTRNIYRKTARAFSGDAQALHLVNEGIEKGDDVSLPFIQQIFFYMPLMHSEKLEDHHKIIKLLKVLLDKVSEDRKEIIENTLKYAHDHKVLIERFGRYPHRNEILGRSSTQEEELYLEKAERFGQ